MLETSFTIFGNIKPIFSRQTNKENHQVNVYLFRKIPDN